MRFSKPKQPKYDAERYSPAIRSSICTGEKAAGFVDRETGRFREVMLVRTEKDLTAFCRQYGVEEPIETIY